LQPELYTRAAAEASLPNRREARLAALQHSGMAETGDRETPR